VTLNAGSYSVSETGPSGYSSSFSADCSGSIAAGQTKTCTVTNNDQPATLIVIKHVINDNGGTAVASNFTMTVTGNSPNPSSFPGAESPGTTVTMNAGAYNVSESGPSGYNASFSVDCTGTIAVGQTKTCTVTNDDIAAPPPPAVGFMTGGGQFNPDGTCANPKNDVANFGGNASGPPPKGHFNYLNHCTGLQINGDVTAIDSVTVVNNVTVQMTFEVAFGSGCTAFVTWQDVAEPGRNADKITLTITGTGCPPNQAATAVTIDNGNIQGHAPNTR
jgi:hypothetical protein